MKRHFKIAVAASLLSVPFASAASVLSFWGFADNYSFPTDSNKLNFSPDAGLKTSANLQAYIGIPGELDVDGGGGFVSYTSTTSGTTYQPTRTLKWDDLKGGGDDFDIAGQDAFTVDKMDGAGALSDDFGNDALIYLTMDTLGFKEISLRFDVEGTPGDLPSSFDVFYRVGGSGTWFRFPSQDNIALAFNDYAVADPDNQFADSGLILLSGDLSNQGMVEIIINDFDENGNKEMEIDNIEIIGTAVPEPSVLAMMFGGLLLLGRRKR